MTSHEPEDLNRLLSDAVSDIEPRSGIEAIRSRTSTTKETPMAITRTWFLGAFGAAVATAAVITAVVVVGNNDDDSNGTDGGPAVTSTPTITGTPQQTDEPSETSAPPPELGAVPVYYVGETAAGLGLYREFHQAEVGGDNGTLAGSVSEAILGDPLDRDYSTYWSNVSEVTTSYNGDFITIDLASDDATALHDGAGLSAEEQAISIQQAIYSAQGGLGQGRKPVQFLINGNHTDSLLGQPASEPLSNDSVLKVNSHVQLSSPNEGDAFSGDTLEFSGVANSFEANVVIRLQRFEGTEIVYQGPATAEGWMEDKLFPFSGSIDISDVPAGQYILMAMEDDPSGGTEGDGADTDTRVITIE